MRFQKFVQRYTKPLFMLLVVIMALSLVMWGYGGSSAEHDPAADAGIIFDNIHVSKGDYFSHRAKAVPSYWWKQMTDPELVMMRRYTRSEPKNPTAEDIARQAWENIVLLQDAAARGIQASRHEVAVKMRDAVQPFLQGKPIDDPAVRLDLIIESVFHTGEAAFEAWAADQAVVDKLLSLVEEGTFADYAEVYDEVFKEHRQAKVWVAAYDPDDYRSAIKPVRPDEIAQHYEANKAKFRVASKIQAAYLILPLDGFKAGVPDPSEDDVRKFYEDRKIEFQDRESKKEPPETKPLEAVRGEIVDRLRIERARSQALHVAERIDIDIGAAFKDGSYPGDLFDRIKEKYAKENVALVHDVTVSFEAGRIEDVEKAVGRNSSLAEWGFQPGRREGEISKRAETDKGFVFFRLQKKLEEHDPGLTEPVRERILKTLEKQRLQRCALDAAMGAKDDIAARGIAAVRREGKAIWRSSRYFETNAGDPGFEDPGLGDAVSRMVSSGQLSAENRTTIIPGMLMDRQGEKRDWSYVAYLDDEMTAPPADVDASFDQLRVRMNFYARYRARQKYVERLVKEANIQDFMNKKEAPAPVQAP